MPESKLIDSAGDVPRGTLDTGLIPVSEAAASLGIPEKRLRGFIARNGIADPIGDMELVYGWSCRELAKRLESTAVEAGAVK